MDPFQIQRNAANKGGVNKEKVLYREKINAQRLNLSYITCPELILAEKLERETRKKRKFSSASPFCFYLNPHSRHNTLLFINALYLLH